MIRQAHSVAREICTSSQPGARPSASPLPRELAVLYILRRSRDPRLRLQLVFACFLLPVVVVSVAFARHARPLLSFGRCVM